MGHYPNSLAEEFACEFVAKKTSLLEQFDLNFPSGDGNIPWDSLVAFNSSTEKPKRLKKPTVTRLRKKLAA